VDPDPQGNAFFREWIEEDTVLPGGSLVGLQAGLKKMEHLTETGFAC